MQPIHQAIIPPAHSGQRIDVVLAQLFPDYSRAQLSSWLKKGAVLINHQHYKPKDKVKGGEQVSLTLEPIMHLEHQAEAIPLEIIFEDKHLLVVNKAAGLIVHPGAGNPRHTLVNALLHYAPDLAELPRAGIIHRLDKETTGLLIVAKTLASHTHLIRQMQAREIQRHYLTLVHGHIIAGGTIDTAYGRCPRNRLKMAVRPQGKQAITHFRVKQQYQFATLLEVQLMTGRTHQIRVHMAHINHPVIGDALYRGRFHAPVGVSDEIRQALQGFNRQALHAYALRLPHPILATELTLTAPLADDFKLLLNVLDHNRDSSPC